MMRIFGMSTLILATTLLVSCAGAVDPSIYAAEKPALDIASYFNGPVRAWGVFQDRSGKVVKRFTVAMDCHWNGDEGTLDESFDYSDGSKQKRIWKLHKTAPNRFVGTADDVVGQAIGVQSGNALHWQYVLAVPVDGKTINFDFDDWMFMIDEHVVLNHTLMSKWGWKAGEVTLSFTKP